VRGCGRAPREGRRPPHDVREASDGRDAHDGGDGGGPEPVVVLLQEEAETRGGEQDAAVENDAELGADRGELAAGDRSEGLRLGVVENALRAKLLDRGDDFGVRAADLTAYGFLYCV